ncbi:hypothetical protein Theam_1759 (plasmid) [Thermovibrio ammonificans HB-1]|uniref:Lipoprotein n=1 Tax=Thermovibrio ammonificans (strain DSM 15698 / JCM 12110 / HB-1) TaxID=648996 RepID=E8T6Z4_THEA1|nr:hypothetical protein [Thermovibrio ammonificans]ADU97715.1 hypothetical protein Theam_1759 [Thermovibrio ammonificans HB-1]
MGVRSAAIAVIAGLVIAGSSYGACNSCGQEPHYRELPYPTCLSQVELIIQNSYAYGPQDIRRILPFVEQANRAFYRCGRFKIATGEDITVIVDSEKGIVYLTRYPFSPEER